MISTSTMVQRQKAVALAMLLSFVFVPVAVAQQKPPAEQPQTATPPAPEPPQSSVDGTILDAVGQPVPGCRVIARQAEGTDVYVSPPSDEEGNYTVVVPADGSYRIIALVSPTGGRTAVPEGDPLQVSSAPTTHDLHLPMAMGPATRKNGKDFGGADRLFLSFVEDPALADGTYLEGRFDYASFGGADTFGLGFVVAAQFKSIPQVEIGGRGAVARVSTDRASSETGSRDLELWGKLDFYRSGNNRADLTAGALLTLPTGDDDIGLGRDAWQSKLFVAGSYSFTAVALIASVGLRVTGNGSVQGIPLEGAVSGSAAIGVIIPFSSNLSLTTELDYQGERFDGFGEDARIAFGVNWRVLRRGVVRGAVVGGLVDDSANARIVAGFGYTF